MNKTKQKPYWIIFVMLIGLTVFSAFLGLRCGSADLTLQQVVDGLLHPGTQTPQSQILWVVRLPHVAACLLAGMGLAVSGMLLQTATDNPLAGPNIIGVNAGAGFAMVLAMCFAPMAYRWLPLMAFAGAFACTLLIVLIARRAGGSRVTIVLAGVAVSTLLSAATSLLRLRYPDLAVSYTYFFSGRCERRHFFTVDAACRADFDGIFRCYAAGGKAQSALPWRSSGAQSGRSGKTAAHTGAGFCQRIGCCRCVLCGTFRLRWSDDPAYCQAADGNF